MLRIIWLSLMLAAGIARVAHATPPQVVAVSDILFAANDSHIFLLRNLEDNMGFYGVVQTDVLLVARNRTTNVDDKIWPVARSVDYGAFEDPGPDGRVQTLVLKDAVNPFDIVAAQGAWLTLGTWGHPNPSDTAVTTLGDSAIILQDDGARYALDFGDLAKLIRENLERTRDRLPAYSLEGGYDALQDVNFDPAVDCRFGESLRIFDGDDRVTWLADVSCENDETMAPVATFLVMKQQE
jgi:hypothetical protein